MSFLFQLTSSLLYDLLFVIIITVALVTIFGNLAAREQKRSIRKFPTIMALIAPNVARSWRRAEEEGLETVHDYEMLGSQSWIAVNDIPPRGGG